MGAKHDRRGCNGAGGRLDDDHDETTPLKMTVGGARAADEMKYPNWKGQWDIT